MHNLHQTLEENINCIKALSIQRALEQLEHMTEVVFVSQSVTANYHSFHSSSRLDKHLAGIVQKPTPLVSLKHTPRSANTLILLIG